MMIAQFLPCSIPPRRSFQVFFNAAKRRSDDARGLLYHREDARRARTRAIIPRAAFVGHSILSRCLRCRGTRRTGRVSASLPSAPAEAPRMLLLFPWGTRRRNAGPFSLRGVALRVERGRDRGATFRRFLSGRSPGDGCGDRGGWIGITCERLQGVLSSPPGNTIVGSKAASKRQKRLSDIRFACYLNMS